MGKIKAIKEQIITTSDGMKYVRRVTTVEMPNGNLRYPVDYYDASDHAVTVSHDELERLRIPVYERLIN